MQHLPAKTAGLFRHKGSAFLIIWLVIAGCATTGEQTEKNRIARLSDSRSSEDAGTGASSTAPGPNGSLNGYVAYALKHSPALEAQFERWQAGVHRISQARRLPDPVISYTYYIRQVETRVGPQRQKVSLKQAFPWPTRLTAGADAASARARSQQERFDAAAISVASKVEQTYWEIWAIQESRKTQEFHESVLSALSESANALIMTGKIELADQQQIDLTRARIEDALSALDEQRRQKEAELRGTISAPQEMTIQVTDTPVLEETAFDEPSLLLAVKNHPALQSFDAMAQSSALDARREETSRYPDFSVVLDWIETGKAQNMDTPESGKDAWMIGVGVSIPLWQQSYRASIDAYHADEKAYMADKQAATDSAVAMMYQTVSKLKDARRRIALYEKTLVPQAEAVYESVLGAYAGGRGSVASTLLAQQALLELRLQLIQAQADYLGQMARLKNLAGHDLKHKAANDDK